jgi:hypothetical protein
MVRHDAHIHVVPAVLFYRWFTAPIMGRNTRVDIKIHNNYKVKATFSCQGTTYEFNLHRWAKIREDVLHASSSFNYFVHLLEERFGHLVEFGNSTVEALPEGGEKSTIVRSQQQITNILKYGTVDVFTCAEQIIQTHRRSVLDYAIFHRELNRHSTYEEYIHLMACHCLVHSNFHAPNVSFKLVDFCTEEHEYNPALLGTVNSNNESDQDDEDV